MNEAIATYIADVTNDATTNLKEPKAHDLSRWAEQSKKGGYFDSPYKPEPGCKARLKLKDGVLFSYKQSDWYDYQKTAVPFEIESGADMSICKKNLSAFCHSLRSEFSEVSYELFDGFVVFTVLIKIGD